MRSEYPSFTFGTNGARSPSVLASPFGPMAHTGQVSQLTFETDGARKPSVLALPLGPMVHAVLCLFGPNQGG